MKIHPEDPRLTSFVLGELKPDDAAAVERAAADDPALQKAIDELDDVGQLLTDTLFATKPQLRPGQRQAILQAASNPDLIKNVVRISDHRRSWKPVIALLAAAALLIFALVVFTRLPLFDRTMVADNSQPGPANPQTETEEWRTIPIDIALLPAPGPVDFSKLGKNNAVPAGASVLAKAAAARNEELAKSGDTYYQQVAERFRREPLPDPSDLPTLAPRGSIVAAASPQLPIPVQAGSLSLTWIADSVRKKHKLPPSNAVRVEEILNHFALRPAGPAAVAQGVTLSTETLPCPWKPSASLLIVALRGAADSAKEIEATFKADTSAVSRYRLLGFAPVAGIPDSALPTHLPAKALTIVAIEIEPTGTSTRLGTVEWTVNGQAAPPVSLVRQPDAEPSDDARFASLLCTYGQWLTGDQSDLIDGDIVAALAREVASDHLPPDRFDLLNLIDQSLNL